ncbi:MAG: hypothetical protein AAF546_00535 [Verrucomicrobiota bacterium]
MLKSITPQKRQKNLPSIAAMSEAAKQSKIDLWPGDGLCEFWEEQIQEGVPTAPVIKHFSNYHSEIREGSCAIRGNILYKLLKNLGQDLHEAEYVSTWRSLDALRDAAEMAGLINDLETNAEHTADLIYARLVIALPHSSEALLLNAKEGILSILSEWPTEAKDLNAAEAQFSFLGLTLLHLIACLEATTEETQTILTNLEAALVKDPGLILDSPLEIAFRVLWENLRFQPALKVFRESTFECGHCDQQTWCQIAALAYSRSQYPANTAALLEGLRFESMEGQTFEPDFYNEDAPWKKGLHQDLERSFAEIFIKASETRINLIHMAGAIKELAIQLKPEFKRIAANLAQGLPGSESEDQLYYYCEELTIRAYWSCLRNSNDLVSKLLFQPNTVIELGIDPQKPTWSKYAQLVSELQEVYKQHSGALSGSRPASLLATLGSHIAEIQNTPVRLESKRKDALELLHATFESDASKYALNHVILLLELQSYQRRIHGRTSRLRNWMASSLFDDELSPNTDQILTALEKVCNYLKESLKDNQGNSSLQDLYSACKSLMKDAKVAAAACQLAAKAEVIATEVEQIVTRSPAWEGSDRLDSKTLRLDALIHLQLTANALIQGGESPAETLSGRWHAPVAGSIHQGSEEARRQILAAIYQAVSSHMDADDAFTSLSLIADAFDDAYQTQCLESILSQPTPAIGPLASHISIVRANHAKEKDFSIETELLANAVLYVANTESKQASEELSELANLFVDFHKLAYNYGNFDIAASLTLSRIKYFSTSDIKLQQLNTLRSGIQSYLKGKSANQNSIQLSYARFLEIYLQSQLGASIIANSQRINEVCLSLTNNNERLENSLSSEKLDTLTTRIGQLLQSSSPQLIWLDINRLYLELIAVEAVPSAEYWKNYFHAIGLTVTQSSGQALQLLCCRFVSQAEVISDLWPAWHELGYNCFRHDSYQFSAKQEHNREQANLLIAALTVDSLEQTGAYSADLILKRFALSSSLSFRKPEEIQEIIGNILDKTSGTITHTVSGLLRALSVANTFTTEVDVEKFVFRHDRDCNKTIIKDLESGSGVLSSELKTLLIIASQGSKSLEQFEECKDTLNLLTLTLPDGANDYSISELPKHLTKSKVISDCIEHVYELTQTFKSIEVPIKERDTAQAYTVLRIACDMFDSGCRPQTTYSKVPLKSAFETFGYISAARSYSIAQSGLETQNTVNLSQWSVEKQESLEANPQQAIANQRSTTHLDRYIDRVVDGTDLNYAVQDVLGEIFRQSYPGGYDGMLSQIESLLGKPEKSMIEDGSLTTSHVALLSLSKRIRQIEFGNHLQGRLDSFFHTASSQEDGRVKLDFAPELQRFIYRVGSSFAFESPERAWIDIIGYRLDLAKTGMLSLDWIKLADALTAGTKLNVTLEAWEWLEALRRMESNFQLIQKTLLETIQTLAEKLSAEIGASPRDWKGLLMTLAAASLAPEKGVVTGKSILENGYLASDLSHKLSDDLLEGLSEKLESVIESTNDTPVPNIVKRELGYVSSMLSNIEVALKNKRHSDQVALLAFAGRPTSKDLWSSQLIMRVDEDGRYLKPDSLDNALARANRTDVPTDETLVRKRKQLSRILTTWNTMDFRPAAGKAGLLGRLLAGKQSNKGLESEEALLATIDIVVCVFASSVILGMKTEEATKAIFATRLVTLSLGNALAENVEKAASELGAEIGENHALIETLNGFAKRLRHGSIAARIRASMSTAFNSVNLSLLGVVDQDYASDFYEGTSADEGLERIKSRASDRNHPLNLSKAEIAELEKLSRELIQSFV